MQTVHCACVLGPRTELGQVWTFVEVLVS